MLDTLSAIILFQGLPKDKLGKIVPHCQEMIFQRGAVIFKESDEENDLYVLLKGRVSVEMGLPAELVETARLAMMQEGQILGEMSFISGARRSATVRVLDEVKALMINAEGLYEVMEEDNQIGYVVMKHLAECLRRRLDDTSLMWRNIFVRDYTDEETTSIPSRDRRSGQRRKLSDRRSGRPRRVKKFSIDFPDRRRPIERRELPDRRSGRPRREANLPIDFPDRRCHAKRRELPDRRSGRPRRVANLPIDFPGRRRHVERRKLPDRRSGRDRRREAVPESG